MKRRLALLAALVLPLTLALAAVYWLAPQKPSGPTFRGRTAAEWEREVAGWELVAFEFTDDESIRPLYHRPAPTWRVWLNRAAGGRWPPADPEPVPAGDAALARGGPEAFPVLLELLRSADPRVRRRAAQVLGFTRPLEAARPAVPALLKALDDPDSRVREAAAATVLVVDPQAAHDAGWMWNLGCPVPVSFSKPDPQ